MSETRPNEGIRRRVLMHFNVMANKNRCDICDAVLAGNVYLSVAKDLLRCGA